MSYREAQRWASYIRNNGPLNSTRRIEWMLSKVCWVIQAAQGGKAKLEDFIPEYGEPEEPEATIEQFAAILSMARIK